MIIGDKLIVDGTFYFPFILLAYFYSRTAKKLTITYFENGIEVDIWHVLQVFNKMESFWKHPLHSFLNNWQRQWWNNQIFDFRKIKT